MLRQILFTGFGSILFLTLSVMLRKNSLIPIIAVLLVLLFEALRPGRNGKMRLGLLIMAVCLAVTSVGILPLIQKCYEKKAGNTLSSGVTAMSYLAMGMQEASRGCGWYNGFNIDTYDTAGMDTALANEISRLAIPPAHENAGLPHRRCRYRKPLHQAVKELMLRDKKLEVSHLPWPEE
jgi:hypothetical protein